MRQTTVLDQTLTFTIRQTISTANDQRKETPMVAQPAQPAQPHDEPRRLILPFNSEIQRQGTSGPQGWTLAECFDAWLRESIKRDRAQTTLSGYKTALNHWSKFCEWAQSERAQDYLSCAPADLSCARAGYAELVAFRDWMLREKPDGAGFTSTQSVRRVEACIMPIVGEAKRRGLRGDVPELPKLKIPRKRPGSVSLAEVQALCDAADVATKPTIGHIPPGDTWRAWLLLFWVYGARTKDFVGYTQCDGLLWESVIAQRHCPDDAVQAENDHGWLEWQPRKTRNSVGLPILLPMHPLVAEQLEKFRGIDKQRVFPIPRNTKAFFPAWHAIRQAANLDDRVSISGDGRGGRRSIRKGCSNNWDKLGRGLGSVVLGHTPSDTNNAHYAQAIPTLVELLPKLEVPTI